MKTHKTSHRVEKVGDEIRRELSNVLLFEMRDPRLHGITITQVRMTADLREAWVYYDCNDAKDERSAADQALAHATGSIRQHIGKTLQLKYVPELIFQYDESRKIFNKAEQLLETAHHERSKPGK